MCQGGDTVSCRGLAWQLAVHCTQCGRTPHVRRLYSIDSADGPALMLKIATKEVQPLIPDACSDCLRQFLGRCFQLDWAKRPGAEDLLRNEFIVSQLSMSPTDLKSPSNLADFADSGLLCAGTHVFALWRQWSEA